MALVTWEEIVAFNTLRMRKILGQAWQAGT